MKPMALLFLLFSINLPVTASAQLADLIYVSGEIITVNDAQREAERLTPMEALKTITLWGAYQHFEEKYKGSLKVGKLADLVILDRNPLTVDPLTIRDIKVVETIKEGKTAYMAE